MIRFAVLLLALSTSGVHAQQWRVHSYPEDGFEVQFNGFVNVRPIAVSAEVQERIVRGTQYMQETSSAVYVVGASLNKQALAFENGVKRSFEGLSCKTVLTDRVIATPWGEARELRGTGCVDGNYRADANYHRSGLWFYQVLVLYREDVGDETSARYFLQSFKLLR